MLAEPVGDREWRELVLKPMRANLEGAVGQAGAGGMGVLYGSQATWKVVEVREELVALVAQVEMATRPGAAKKGRGAGNAPLVDGVPRELVVGETLRGSPQRAAGAGRKWKPTASPSFTTCRLTRVREAEVSAG